jgi:hypothetical protein
LKIFRIKGVWVFEENQNQITIRSGYLEKNVIIEPLVWGISRTLKELLGLMKELKNTQQFSRQLFGFFL